MEQAKAIEHLKIDAIIELDVPLHDTVALRLSKRGRADDGNAAVWRRLHLFLEHTLCVINHYSTQDNFYEIDGTQGIEKIHKEIRRKLCQHTA